jgi:hypothetical protein
MSAHSYTQTFKRASEQLGEDQWVTDDEPKGPCGIVYQSRFKRAALPGGGDSMLWDYVAEYRVTHRSTRDGNICSGIAPDSQWAFSWQQDEALSDADCGTFQFNASGGFSPGFPLMRHDGPPAVIH